MSELGALFRIDPAIGRFPIDWTWTDVFFFDRGRWWIRGLPGRRVQQGRYVARSRVRQADVNKENEFDVLRGLRLRNGVPTGLI